VRIHLCGVRGSTPAPGAEFVRYGGHTSCVAIAPDSGAPRLILDAGTGLRRVTGLLRGEPFAGTIILTHLHWDHVHGLPFFSAGDRDGARVTLLLPEQEEAQRKEGSAGAEEVLARGMSPPHFPITPAGLEPATFFYWLYLLAGLVVLLIYWRQYSAGTMGGAEYFYTPVRAAELLLKGGKTGPVWDSTRPDLGLLLQRIHLPPEEEKHMPPKGKPQLTETEVTILYQWLKHDPTHSIRVADLGPADTLRQLAASLFKGPAEEDVYDFDPADEATVQKLNTSYRIVYPVALHSPALNVDFYSPQFFKSSQLKDLEPLSRQIVALNLDKMPVTDADIPTIARFSNLRVLNLSFTGVTGAGIAGLKTLEKLKSLSLSGTVIKAEDLTALSPMKSLRRLYVWNTAIAPGTIRNTNGSLRIEGGSRTDTMLLKLNPPILQNEETILREPVALRLKHYVPGVTIRYSVDGSEPDSSRSLLYTAGQVMLTQRTDFSAQAFKKGWLPSEVIHTYFYSEKYRPDSVRMLQPIDSNYMKYGGKTLIDLTKGDLNFNSGKWLGFRKNKMECLLFFDKPIMASDVTLSAQVNVGASIMPPVSIEVWGGAGPGALRLLSRITPDTAKAPGSAYLTPYDLSFHPVRVSCIKVVMTPVGKLPEWHGEKGKKGWVFVDEVFVN